VAIEGISGFRGGWGLIRQLLNNCQGNRYFLVTTTLACRNETRWSANSQAAVDNYILVDYVVIAVRKDLQSLAWRRWHRQISRKCIYYWQFTSNNNITNLSNKKKMQKKINIKLYECKSQIRKQT